MDTKPTPRRKPWSLRRKLLIFIPLIIVVLALALGLGLGLTLGNDNGEETDDNNTAPSTPNTTLPWTPSVSDTWQIILLHPPIISSSRDQSTTPNVSIFDIDLFDTPKETIDRLHERGKKVICYFSAGSYEDWRPDASEFQPEDLGEKLDGWPGEKWVDLSSENVRRIMRDRISMAAEKGCDGVDPDNVDGYQNENGLSLTQDSSIDFITYLSAETRPFNLALGLKNAGDIIPAVLPLVHFSVNEQCVEYGECDTFEPFIAAGKPVFHIEYPDGAGAEQGLQSDVLGESCAKSGDGRGSEKFSTVLKRMDLDGWVEYCDGSVERTDVDESVGRETG
ncbi:endo alpha-1,4 polygalactosaminidase precursor [Decorospora gaudefroyi]|uniref:alpha-galactosidase n=1 Tax=Decorospora gaudefroyi TaxID=184978 RepID=A0A6A5KIH2_9PLEO|nr:endo alpha-1,4 polygalactosaminidase precursor [Decorospora gaudefroyi]